MVTLGELAAALELEAPAALAARPLRRIASLERAGPDSLSFMTGRRYLPQLRRSGAGCVLLAPQWAAQSPVPVLCCEDPYLMYARASRLFRRESAPGPAVHPQAVVHPQAILGREVCIGAGACIGPGAVLGDGAVIDAGVQVGPGARVGARSRLYPGVVLYHDVRIGADCTVHANTVIGADGFGFARGPRGWEKIHQLGSVEIGDGVEIGAGVTIDRGALEDTRIADGVIIDNQVHIAHNCRIGARTAIAGCAGFAGSVSVGEDCSFAGQVGVSGHLQICDNAHFTGQARVSRSIHEPGSYSSGTPLDTTAHWRRSAVRFRQLDALQQRIRALEAALRGSDARSRTEAGTEQS